MPGPLPHAGKPRSPSNHVGRRQGGELLGATGKSGHRHAVDALLATVALRQSRPKYLLTSDLGDMARLSNEPRRMQTERIAMVAI